jgi:hypothetical protein
MLTISMIASDVILPFQTLSKEQKETLFYRLLHCLRHPPINPSPVLGRLEENELLSEIRSSKFVSPSHIDYRQIVQLSRPDQYARPLRIDNIDLDQAPCLLLSAALRQCSTRELKHLARQSFELF